MTDTKQRYFYKGADGLLHEVTAPRKCPSFPLTFRLATRLADGEKVYFSIHDMVVTLPKEAEE